MRLELSTTQQEIRTRAAAGEVIDGLGMPAAVLVAGERGHALTPPHDDRPLPRCAYLIGVAARALAEARSHVVRREQFGASLSRYQAVTFPLAQQHIRLEGLRWRVLELATVDGQDDELPALVRRRAYEAVTYAVHVHGALGLVEDTTVSRCHRAVIEPEPARFAPVGSSVSSVPAAWTGTVGEVDNTTVVDLFTRAAADFADAPAVVADEATLTYRELHARANQVAHALRAAGAGRDTVVGVYLPRGPDLVAAVLGVLVAGSAYLPLDPDYPPERVRFMIEDSGTPVIVTADWLAEWLPETPADILCVDSDLASFPHTAPPTSPARHDLAYLIYTSGSSGTPKGVQIEHRGVANRLRWDRERFPLGPQDAVLQHTSLSFDIAVWELFAPLVSGARLVLAKPGGDRDPDYLTAMLHEHRITGLAVVPSFVDVLLDAEPGLAAPSLRYLFCGGEALQPALCERVFEALPSVRLHNFYGPTEATVDVTSWRVTPANLAAGVPIGRPLDNVRAYVLDDIGAMVPVGFTGELHVGGVGVARGYHNRPELTRTRFLPDPFDDRPDARMYRTGDLVRHRADGALEFLGRIDEQVKVRGFRVELGEIETALERHEAVRQAVVVASGDRLAAQVVGTGSVPTGQELRAYLLDRLPEYMVPTVIAPVPAFPLMPNGKVDRAAVRSSARATVHEGPEPANAVARLMRDILGVPEVALKDDFFQLGGTSLQAARFVTRLRKRLGVDVDLARFLEEPTCAAVLR